MGFGTAREMIALDASRKSFAFAHADHIHQFANLENGYSYLVTLFEFWLLDTELTKKAQRRDIVALKMTQLTTAEAFWLCFAKTQLDR